MKSAAPCAEATTRQGTSAAMATVSPLPLHRPKKVVRYGKNRSRTTYGTIHADTWPEIDDPPAQQPATVKDTAMKKRYNVQRPERKEGARREAKVDAKAGTKAAAKTEEKKETSKVSSKSLVPRAKEKGIFEAPSSGDEAEMMGKLKRPRPPVPKTKHNLVDDTVQDHEQLAPWEKSKPAPAGRASETKAESAKAKTAKPVKMEEKIPRKTTSKPISQARASEREHEPMTAAARLAARRQHAKGTPRLDAVVHDPPAPVSVKRTMPQNHSEAPAMRKRARNLPPNELRSPDVPIGDAPSALGFKRSPVGNDDSNHALDVFDLPADESEIVVASRRKPIPPKAATLKRGHTAPARLAEMLPVDTDSTDAPSRSPSLLITGSSTPRETVSRSHTSTPPSPLRAAARLTPKQAQLWNQLLPSDPIVPTPSSLAMKDLTLHSKPRTKKDEASLKPTLSNSVTNASTSRRRRTRLVDRLKASAQSSEDEPSEPDAEMADADVEDVAEAASEPSQHAVEGSSQSQHQTTLADAGTKITYARTRSYLPEDDLEDGLMLDSPAFMPQWSSTLVRQASKISSASQKSAFDLDDGDEEGPTGRLKTIHELRAAGRNDRFVRDTEALLEDITDHMVSAKSRRRSALMELAVKLMDTNYAERFVGQSFEYKLLSECSASPDEIADPALCSAFASLLVTEPPQRMTTSLADAGLLGWCTKLLDGRLPLVQLAKDRRNNMSKVAQSSVADFAEKIRVQQTLWEKPLPSQITPRILALKVLDLLVSQLRRFGDRSELLDGTQIGHIIRGASDENVDSPETSLSISVLESLSTSALALAWPTKVIERVATISRRLMVEPGAHRHDLFLAYRLALNLTNDNASNCTTLAESEVVGHLLTAVQGGFLALDGDTDSEEHAVNMDLLVLAMGIMINLAEHNQKARQEAMRKQAKPALVALLNIFQAGQKRIEEAASVEESTTNVAFGYLAVMLANICLDAAARAFIASRLPRNNLDMLIAAVEEFVRHHQRVDMLNFEGTEGREVWGAFTARLQAVLDRFRAVAAIE